MTFTQFKTHAQRRRVDMPISNKTGHFMLASEVRSNIETKRYIANFVLRLAKERGIQNSATKRAEADLVEAEKLEKEYFQ